MTSPKFNIFFIRMVPYKKHLIIMLSCLNSIYNLQTF
nr:MAG TPA: hypothetical protein [Bacteriophage sp.]